MGKLKVLPGKEICKILFQNGFVQARQKGSHIIMQKSIIRQPRLKKELFLT
ncbi:MAG: type II toxin-antitoxin system HicA family toxin [Bacteroidetes bacterium]|nr:type II toxin-antitoxin system HicA family toxin [Bacteroidota bacterium]MBU1421980.1 type II toxin-antitoxin system HicA family toxin [Bacteroidota bacterium]MBU2635773.1 type II toxin-antitoxin system HicA family toxin [Bacteroidota bacterium]